MKKIGIVTFWDSQDNYGQLLQCFASIQFFKSLGYDSRLIKVITHINTSFFHKFKTLLFLLFSPKRLYEVVLNKKIGKERHFCGREYDFCLKIFVKNQINILC